MSDSTSFRRTQTASWHTGVTRLFLAWLVGTALLASGCRSKECARMMACCQQVKDVDGMGEACGPQANTVEDPKTCKTILETIGYMFEEKEKELPAVCKEG
ncbi:MAG: hypothetical protein ABEN55_10325 [Bradymonadaceae bacterium]